MSNRKGKLTVEDEQSMEQFFNNISLIEDEEKAKAEEVLDKAEEVDWPVDIIFDLTEETWQKFAEQHPDEAKILEQFVEEE